MGSPTHLLLEVVSEARNLSCVGVDVDFGVDVDLGADAGDRFWKQ